MNQWTKVDNNKNNNLLLPNHCMIEAVDNRHYRTLRTCKAQLGMVTTETNIFHNPTFVFKINVWIFWKYSHYKNSFRANYFEEVPKVLLVVWDGQRRWYQKVGMTLTILCFPQLLLLHCQGIHSQHHFNNIHDQNDHWSPILHSRRDFDRKTALD